MRIASIISPVSPPATCAPFTLPPACCDLQVPSVSSSPLVLVPVLCSEVTSSSSPSSSSFPPSCPCSPRDNSCIASADCTPRSDSDNCNRSLFLLVLFCLPAIREASSVCWLNELLDIDSHSSIYSIRPFELYHGLYTLLYALYNNSLIDTVRRIPSGYSLPACQPFGKGEF